jgi:hypothetical protein
MRRFAWSACHSRTINHCRATCKVIWRNGYYKRKRGVKSLKFTWINGIKLRYGYLFDTNKLKTEQYSIAYGMLSHRKTWQGYKIPNGTTFESRVRIRKITDVIFGSEGKALAGFLSLPSGQIRVTSTKLSMKHSSNMHHHHNHHNYLALKDTDLLACSGLDITIQKSLWWALWVHLVCLSLCYNSLLKSWTFNSANVLHPFIFNTYSFCPKFVVFSVLWKYLSCLRSKGIYFAVSIKNLDIICNLLIIYYSTRNFKLMTAFLNTNKDVSVFRVNLLW